MEEALLARLRADSAIISAVATVNGRPAVDWVERPSDAALPALTLQDISPGRSYTHGGAVDLTNPLVQIDCWGRSYGAVKTLSRAVIAELEAGATVAGVVFTFAFLVSSRGMDPEDLGSGVKVFRISMDFRVWSKPA